MDIEKLENIVTQYLNGNKTEAHNSIKGLSRCEIFGLIRSTAKRLISDGEKRGEFYRFACGAIAEADAENPMR